MEQRIKMKELNEFITCSICSGYLINASTVTECLHTCTLNARNFYILYIDHLKHSTVDRISVYTLPTKRLL